MEGAFLFCHTLLLLATVVQTQVRVQPNILEEVCEGETFLLECPVGTLIHLDPAVLTEFGRNGAWEVESGGSRCGSENVSDCSVVPVPLATFLQPRPCHGKQTCEVALSRALGHLCLGRRKYLTINFTCNAEKVEGEIFSSKAQMGNL